MRGPDDTLTTERLVLRRFSLDDLEIVHGLNSDPEVMRFIAPPFDREKSRAMLEGRILEYYAANPGLGIWKTIERATGECVGLHLLNHMHGETFIQVGYLLFPRFWGRGYASEMAAALLRYGFTALGLPRIHAITDLAHVDSQKVLLKVGLHRKGERTLAHPAYAPGPLAWFERDAADWLAERPL